MHRTIQTLYFLTLISFSVSAVSTPIARFPETQARLSSPSKAFHIVSQDSDQEPHHSLFLRDEHTGASRKVVDYGRHVEVSWAPGSDYFFVNDYMESTDANCLVYDTADLKPVDVGQILKSKKELLASDRDHLFVVCKKWKGATIQVSASGWNGSKPDGFEYKYLVNIATKDAKRMK